MTRTLREHRVGRDLCAVDNLRPEHLSITGHGSIIHPDDNHRSSTRSWSRRSTIIIQGSVCKVSRLVFVSLSFTLATFRTNRTVTSIVDTSPEKSRKYAYLRVTRGYLKVLLLPQKYTSRSIWLSFCCPRKFLRVLELKKKIFIGITTFCV